MEQGDLDLLTTVQLPHLQTLVRTRHIAVPVGQRNEVELTSPAVLMEIARALFDESALRQVIASLEPHDALILRELVACGGRANSRDLAFYFQQSGLLTSTKEGESSVERFRDGSVAIGVTVTPVQYPPAHPHGAFELAVHRLLIQGLVFWGKQTHLTNRDYASGTHDGVLIVPQTVRQVMLATGHMTTPSTDEAAVVGLSDAMRLLQRQLYQYWSFVAYGREKLTVLGSGLLTRGSLRHILECMEPGVSLEQARTESDFPRLLFIRQLLQQLGLLQVRNTVIQAQPAQAFFSLPLWERVRRCFRLWLESSFWNELAYLPDVVVRPAPTPLETAHEETIRARRTVVERLFFEPHGQWQPMMVFIARTKLYAPYLLFPRQYGPRTDRYINGNNPYGADFRLRRGWLTHREGWYMVEGGFIRSVLTGPLSWLGLVEVERDPYPNRFLVHPAAQVIADDRIEPPTDDGQGRLIVQPNFELVVLAPVSESLLISLDRFAERVSLELIAQYRLSKASVTRAVQMGMQAETIVEELARAAGSEIPQNVCYSIMEWERQARRIELWQKAVLVEVDDAALLDELFAREETRQFLRRRLAPLLAEVEPQHLDTLQALLWQRDYLPSLATAPGQDAVMDNGRFVMREAQWRLWPDGRLQPLYSVLDLYLMAELQRMAERDEVTGELHITPTTLEKALANGLSLDYIIRFLQQFCQDGIPPSFLIRLKLWGGGYGGEQVIAVENQPLLRLPAQMVRDLRADDELRPLLGTEVEQSSRLVRVRRENLTRVLELLRERGFAVDESEF
jgi:hypothetical protein